MKYIESCELRAGMKKLWELQKVAMDPLFSDEEPFILAARCEVWWTEQNYLHRFL